MSNEKPRTYPSLQEFADDNKEWMKRCVDAQQQAKEGKPEALKEILEEVEKEK